MEVYLANFIHHVLALKRDEAETPAKDRHKQLNIDIGIHVQNIKKSYITLWWIWHHDECQHKDFEFLKKLKVVSTTAVPVSVGLFVEHQHRILNLEEKY